MSKRNKRGAKSVPAIQVREHHTDGTMRQRAAHVTAKSLNEESRTVNADVATESPVPMPDYGRGIMVPEILLGSGAKLPRSGQVPLLDSHSRYTTAGVIGSARQLQVEPDGRVTGVLHFSGQAQREFDLVREGHVTDVSAGYRVLKSVHVPAGEVRSFGNKRIEGPANVVTAWRLDEVSLVPIGADPASKLRSEEGGFMLKKHLRDALVKRGMPAELSDEDAVAWSVENPAPATRGAGDKGDDDGEDGEDDEPRKPARRKRSAADDEDAEVERLAERMAKAARKAEEKLQAERAAWSSEVNDMCALAGVPQAAEHCRSLPDRKAVVAYLTEEAKKREASFGSGAVIRVTGEGAELLARDIQTAIVLRAANQVAPPRDTFVSEGHEKAMIEHRAKVRAAILPDINKTEFRGAETFRHASLFDMAHEWVRCIYGINTRGMYREQIAQIAILGPEMAVQAAVMNASLRAAGGYLTTAQFSNATLDAMNKSTQLGYQEAPSTWEGPMRRGESVQDFKTIHRVRLSSTGDLPIWNDNDDPMPLAMTDGKEAYAVDARSGEISFTYRLLVNDDMSVLGRVPGQLGQSARRTVNKVAWSQITANRAMSDGVNLFAAATGARKRTNLTTGAGAPSTTTLQTLTNLMMQMRGENDAQGNESTDILALRPRFIAGPSALYTTIMQLVLSVYDPANANMVYNTAANLIPVIEPLLDADSTTAWYLFADPGQIDTVEVTFLAGQETPQIRQYVDPRKMSQHATILQSFGAKPLNHRGMQKHAGA